MVVTIMITLNSENNEKWNNIVHTVQILHIIAHDIEYLCTCYTHTCIADMWAIYRYMYIPERDLCVYAHTHACVQKHTHIHTYIHVVCLTHLTRYDEK